MGSRERNQPSLSQLLEADTKGIDGAKDELYRRFGDVRRILQGEFPTGDPVQAVDDFLVSRSNGWISDPREKPNMD